MSSDQRTESGTAQGEVRFPLSYKLTLFAAALAVLSLVGVGWAAIALTSSTVETSQRELQVAILETVTRSIEWRFGRAQDDLDALGRALADDALDEEARVLLAEVIVESSEALDNAIIFDMQGQRPIPIVEKSAEALPLPETLDETIRAQAAAREVATGRVHRGLEAPRVLVVVPIRAGEELTGFAATELSLAGLQARVEAQAAAHFTDIPDALFVVDEELRIVAHADPGRARTLESAADEGILAGVSAEALASRFGASGEFTSARGDEVVGSLVSLESRPWAVVAQIPRSIAYADVETLRELVIGAVAVAVVLAFGASIWLSRRITSPLDQLSSFARNLARRDFTTRIDINTADELALVGYAMSQAAADLESSEKQIRQELEIRHDLGRYLPSEIVDKIVRREQDMELGGERREITVMFADVVAFTPMTNALPPEQVVTILNELFTIVTEIVFRNGGTVDKFIGDCVMALWGAPNDDENHARNAVRAAEEIAAWLEIGNASWTERFGVSIRLAMGLNTGEAVVGNVGSESRMEYTAIGDVVNVAARLEAVARPQQILISKATADALGSEVPLARLGSKTLSGRAEAIELYEVV